MAKSGQNLDEFALHSWRIFGAMMLAAGGHISEYATPIEGREKIDAYKSQTLSNRGLRKGCHVI